MDNQVSFYYPLFFSCCHVFKILGKQKAPTGQQTWPISVILVQQKHLP